MLRECRRVLAPGGRMAALVIHTGPDLDERGRARAAELGPSLVASARPMARLVAEAGFREVTGLDRTEAFARTCQAILRARSELEAELRAEGGDEAYEEDRLKKERMLEGIREGLLERTLFVATA